MPKLRDVCRHIRSKNAGPFWVTIDLFFDSRASYDLYAVDRSIDPTTIAALYEVDPDLVRRTGVPSLNVLKISFPRRTPQGGILERDLHAGQQYARLLDIDLP